MGTNNQNNARKISRLESAMGRLSRFEATGPSLVAAISQPRLTRLEGALRRLAEIDPHWASSLAAATGTQLPNI